MRQAIALARPFSRALGAALVLAALAAATLPSLGARQAEAAGGFLTVSGSQFTYNGAAVRLRGENFNNEPALACCGTSDIGAINVNAADYANLHGLGANLVRFGMDYGWYASDRTRFFSVLDQHLAWAQQNQLWVIPVLFIPPGGSSGGYGQTCLWSDCGGGASNQDLLNGFWQDFALHYAGNPTLAGYDLLNEPAPPSAGEWQSLAQRLYATITAADPNHFVAVEEDSSDWDVPVLSGATREVMSSHFYGSGDNLPPSWHGQLPLYIGEFGGRADDGTATTWVSNEIARFESLGLHWSHFVYREPSSAFGLYTCNWTAGGDTSCPWTEMITVVAAGFAGNVLPGSGAGPSPGPSPASPAGGPQVAVAPARVLDTRSGAGGSTLGPASTLPVKVTGVAGVPSTGVRAVTVNLTATNATAAGYLTAFPSGTAVPDASTLNFTPGTSAANLVEVAVGPDGFIDLYNFAGTVDAIVDLQAYVASSPAGSSGLYTALPGPVRVYDSRAGGGALEAGEVRGVPVAGEAGIPATGVAAVVLNVTSADATQPGYLSVTPDGGNAVSTVNFLAGETRANRAMVKLGADGAVRVFNFSGSADVVVDVVGWYGDGASGTPVGSAYTAVAPVRILDTRAASSQHPFPIGAQQAMQVQVVGLGGVPATATSVVLNLTATDTTAAGYLTAFPSGSPPNASDLDYSPAETLSNLVVARIAGDGTIELYNSQGSADLVADVEGWYS